MTISPDLSWPPPAPVKVALAGTHGVGKTTASRELAGQLRLEFPHLRVTVLPEVARKCPWPINQEAGAEAQKWIFHRQLVAELEAGRQADILICDRSSLDNLFYALDAEDRGRPGDWSFIIPALAYLMEVWLATYTYLWWLRPSFPLAADGTRDACPEFQARIDSHFASFAASLNPKPGFWRDWPGLESALTALRRLIIARRLKNILAGAIKGGGGG